MKREAPKKQPPGTSIRYTDRASERAVHRAARLTGKGPSAFVRDAAQAVAERVLAEEAQKKGVCPSCGRPKTEPAAA